MKRRVLAAVLRAAMAAAALELAAACKVEQLDALNGPAEDADGADASKTGLADAPTENGPARDADRADATENGPADAPTDTTSDGSGEASVQACMGAGTPVLSWTFDTTEDSWVLSSEGADVTTSWSGATGDPTPGALEVNFTGLSPDAGGPGATTWVHAEIPTTNLTGRTVSAWVRLNSGPSPQFLSFVQTETAYAWADNGELRLPLGSWTCVSLPISSPVDAYSQYDPTQVVRIGFEMIATAPFQLLIDTVRVQ